MGVGRWGGGEGVGGDGVGDGEVDAVVDFVAVAGIVAARVVHSCCSLLVVLCCCQLCACSWNYPRSIMLLLSLLLLVAVISCRPLLLTCSGLSCPIPWVGSGWELVESSQAGPGLVRRFSKAQGLGQVGSGGFFNLPYRVGSNVDISKKITGRPAPTQSARFDRNH